MRINRIHLQNFRLFADATFHFPGQFTVMIGENGQGKSAVLHGLRVAAGAWCLGLKETSRIHIQAEDIRQIERDDHFIRQFPTIVEARGVIEGQVIDWTRKRTDLKQGIGRTDRAEAKTIIELSRRSEQISNEGIVPIELPVLAYFSTARLWVGAKQTVNLKTKGFKIQDGYAGSLAPSHDRSSALGWIKTTYLKSLEQYQSVRPSVSPSIVPSVPPTAHSFQQAELLQAVLDAISLCVPDWTDLRWGLDADDLVGFYKRPDTEQQERVPLYYLSDGLRTIAGMAAEIAYRCVTLNGHLGREAVRQSTGIILIDELDMHLHPNWQRRIVSDLKTAFPNLQFIATTHSPFIVQSLEMQELINLDRATDTAPVDLRLEDVSEEVMGVKSPLSLKNEENEEATYLYLQELAGQKNSAVQFPEDASDAQLDTLEQSVTDPGLRAIMRIERLLKKNS